MFGAHRNRLRRITGRAAVKLPTDSLRTRIGLGIALATVALSSPAQAVDWTESFKKAFHSSSGADHFGVAAHGHRAILAGKYAVDLLSFDPSDDSWNLDFRINEVSAGGLFPNVPAVAIDGARAAYGRRTPGSRWAWEVRARFHHQAPNQWSTLISGIPGRITSLAFANQTRAVVGYDTGSSWGARIYEYNGASFQHVATMQLGLPQSATGLIVAIEGDWAVAYALESGQNVYQRWLVVYRRSGPGSWSFHQAIPTTGSGLSLAMEDDRLVVGMPFGGSGQVVVYRRQGVLDFYQLEQTLTSPVPRAADYFGYDVDIDDGEIYVSDWGEVPAGNPGIYLGAVHRFIHADGTWNPSVRFVSSQAASGDALGLVLTVTSDHVIATGAQSNGTFYSFDRPWVPPFIWKP